MRKLLFALLLSAQLYAINSPTVGTQMPRVAPDPDFQYTFDHLSSIPAARKYKLGTVLREAHTTLICVYDFATQGGAVGNINLLMEDLKTPCTLPGKAVVRNGFIDLTTTFASSGTAAVVSFSTGQTAADVRGASPGFGAAIAPEEILVSPVYATVSTYIKLTTANSVSNGVNGNPYQPYMTIAGTALTAGHARLFLDYVQSE